MTRCFVLDLDGTVTQQEILPLIATCAGIEEEIKTLTDLTLRGLVEFEASLKLRFALMRTILLRDIHDVVSRVRLDPHVTNFIAKHTDRCFIATGNIDQWIAPLTHIIPCRFFSSTVRVDDQGQLHDLKILRKNEAVKAVKDRFSEVVVIGDSYNDLPMFEVGDIRIAFGGCHQPVQSVISAADYVIYEGEGLCRLLEMLS